MKDKSSINIANITYPVPEEVFTALRHVLDYDMPTEERDFEENREESGDSHIFLDLQLLDNWLRSYNK